MGWAAGLAAAGAASLITVCTPAFGEVAFSSVPDITAAPTGPNLFVGNFDTGTVFLKFTLSDVTYVNGFQVALVGDYVTTLSPPYPIGIAQYLDDAGKPGGLVPGFGGIANETFTSTGNGTTILQVGSIPTLTYTPGDYWLALGGFQNVILPTFTEGSGAIVLRPASGQLTSEPGVAGLRVLSSSAPVPEPGRWALMIVGFGLLGSVLRQRRSSGGCRTTA